jgi:hypothetical protein
MSSTKFAWGWGVLNAYSATLIPPTVDLSLWSVISYVVDPSYVAPNWTVTQATGPTNSVNQSQNSRPSIFLAPFSIQDFTAVFDITGAADDDIEGVVFGYQNRSTFYLYDWKGATQTYSDWGTANRGTTLKLVNVSGGADPTEHDLWPSIGSANTTILRATADIGSHSELSGYRYTITWTGWTIQISVVRISDSAVLDTVNVTNGALSGGYFGYYSFVQGGTYKNLSIT